MARFDRDKAGQTERHGIFSGTHIRSRRIFSFFGFGRPFQETDGMGLCVRSSGPKKEFDLQLTLFLLLFEEQEKEKQKLRLDSPPPPPIFLFCIHFCLLTL